jgi:hypothetical protein
MAPTMTSPARTVVRPSTQSIAVLPQWSATQPSICVIM